MPKNEQPQPVIVRTVCSLCDQPWEAHGDKPTTLDCIRLLKALPRAVIGPAPVYPFVPLPYPRPGLITWYAGSAGAVSPTTTGAATFNDCQATVERRTPEVAAMA